MLDRAISEPRPALLLAAAPAFAAVGEGSAALTGTLAVEIRDCIPGGVEHQIYSRLVDVDGRKLRTEGALVAPDGTNLAVVAATWVTVPVVVPGIITLAPGTGLPLTSTIVPLTGCC